MRQVAWSIRANHQRGGAIMQCTSRSIPARLILALAAGLAACGEGAAAEPQRAAGGRARAVPCPPAAEIETAIGFPVKPVSVPVDGCMYQPATRANDVFAEIKKSVKVRKGQKAEPDSLSLGEGGWAFGSSGNREAA